jgi:pilus assembly protein CpaB
MEAVQKRSPGEGMTRYLGTRRGAITAAVAAAVLAGVVLLVFVHQYKSSVKNGTETESVLVANQLIPKGTAGSAVVSSGLFRPTAISSDKVAANAITDASAIAGKSATRDIYPGQQITLADFRTNSDDLRSALQGSQRAISVPLDPSHGILGIIHDGDRVDVLASVNAANSAPGVSGTVVRTLLQNVLVLRAPTKYDVATNAGKDGNVTLRVGDTDAARLAYASDQGKVWLVLRPPAGAKQSPPAAVTINSLLAGATRGGR